MRYLLFHNNDIAGADNSPFALADAAEQCTGLIINRQKLADDINKTGEFVFALGAWKIQSAYHSKSNTISRILSGGIDASILQLTINQNQ